jgi:hypothetical protein
MGDAGVTTADRGASMHYNPALLLDGTAASAGVTYNAWMSDVTYNHLGIAVPFESWALGLTLGLSSVDNIEVRQVPGEPVGTFDAKYFEVGLGGAVRISDAVRVGLTAKYLFEKLYTNDAGGYAFDLGATWRPVAEGTFSRLMTGVALANAGHMSPLNEESTVLPLSLRYGASWSLPVEALRGEAVFAAEGYSLLEESATHVNLGVEAHYAGAIFARVGYQTGWDVRGFTAGLGAAWRTVRFDYAYSPFSDGFAAGHTVTLSSTF